MMKKCPLVIALFLLITLVACRSLQNEGGTDWATVEFSIDGSNQSSALYSSSGSSIETALIIAVPAEITSVGITDYLSNFYHRQLQDLTNNTVNLRIPLNTPIRLAKVVFKEVCTLDEICSNQPTAFCAGISDAFSITGNDESKSVAITMDTSLYSKAITSFSFRAESNSVLSEDVEGIISGTNISVTVPYGTDVTALVATFTTTGQSVTVGSAVQTSGTTANDSSSAVTYRVIAADGSTQDYTVTVLSDADSQAPTNPSITINGGDASTTLPSVTLFLSANDNAGIVAYFASESNTTPAAGDSGWNFLTSATSYSGSVSFTMSNTGGTKTINVWFKDDAGNVSSHASANAIDTIFYNKSWEQATASASWVQRSTHFGVVFDNKMWVMGGYDGSGSRNDVWYSSDGVSWTQATAAAGWSVRQASSILVFDNKMWLMGGGSNNDVWYSSDGASWAQATAAAGWAARHGHSSIVYDNKMWVIGGLNGANYCNDVWYSSDGISWTQATAAAGWVARKFHSSVVYDNKMWVMGGYGVLATRYHDVWYSSDGVSWTQATTSASWSTRDNHASMVLDNKMWVMGGSPRSNDVWYSSDGISWTQATAAAGWAIRSPSFGLVFDNKMWVMGGSGTSRLNDVWYW